MGGQSQTNVRILLSGLAIAARPSPFWIPADSFCALFVTAGSPQLALTPADSWHMPPARASRSLDGLPPVFDKVLHTDAFRPRFPISVAIAKALPSTDAQHGCGRKTHSLLRMNRCYIAHPGV
jgi:hypothetical protein